MLDILVTYQFNQISKLVSYQYIFYLHLNEGFEYLSLTNSTQLLNLYGSVRSVYLVLVLYGLVFKSLLKLFFVCFAFEGKAWHHGEVAPFLLG